MLAVRISQCLFVRHAVRIDTVDSVLATGVLLIDRSRILCGILTYFRLPYAVTAIPMTSLTLPLLLLLYCHGNVLVGELVANIGGFTSGKHPGGESALDERASSIRAKKSRSSCQPLGGFIACYDIVVPVFTEVPGEKYHRVDFPDTMTALGRSFRLLLHDDAITGEADGLKPLMSWSWVISPSAVVHVVGENGIVREYGRNELGIKWYVGHDSLEVAPSAVLASLVYLNGQQLFRAIIYTSSDVYYVEPASAYSQVKAVDKNASIIYRQSDIVDYVVEGPRKSSVCFNRSIGVVGPPLDHGPDQITPRIGRNLDNGAECELGVVIDHTFYQEVAQSNQNVAVSMVTQHIAVADFVFRTTDMLKLDALPDNIGFSISDIKIYKSPDAYDYRIRDTTLNHVELLNRFSSYNFAAYCLAVAFTFRDFGNGVIGFAWVPMDGMAVGGICERQHWFKASKTLPGGNYSFNTVLVTQLSGEQRLSDALTSRTLIHEIGHSFGALHDEDVPHRTECLPSEDSQHGKYVMSATVSPQVRRAKNWMFSMCSRQAMEPVILFKGACLKPRSLSYCGNSLVENGEQCDCGTTFTCALHDKCCTPRDLHPYSRPEGGCRLKSNSACSPRVHRCCTDDCRLAKAGVTCREMTDCMSVSHCDGLSPSCPAPTVADNGTSCAGGVGQCQGGMCSVSPCQQAGLVDCLCQRPRNHACSVCCRCADAPLNACVPAQWLHLASPSYSLLLPPGSHCLEYGICDNDSRCVTSTPDYVN